MITVYKYPIKLTWEQSVELPMGAQVLYVDMQQENLQLWARVDTAAKTNRRKICIVGTGYEFHSETARYINTFFSPNKVLVFHVFDGGWE